MKSRLMPRVVSGVAVLALGLAAGCSSTSHSPSGNPSNAGAVVEGGTLRLGSSSSIDSLNPFVAINQDGYSTFEYIYPELVQYDANMKFGPDFAKSWSTSADGKVWTFKTQPSAKWSDGKPLTARDAAWTYSTILKFAKTASGNQAATLTHLKSAVAPDDNTLVLTYTVPVANVLSNLQQLPILPEHVWSKYATGNGLALKRYSNTPTDGQPVVSGGPFELVKFQKDQIALFQRNPNWYGPKPHIDGYGLQFFANDDAMVTALKNGEIDAVEGLPNTSMDAVKQAGLTVANVPGEEFHDFIFNSNPKKPKNRELLDPKVRTAFEYAMNRQQIVKTALLGAGQPGSSIVPPASGGGWFDQNLDVIPYDPAKANQILDQLGYKKGPNGIRIANGHPMSYQVIFPSSGASERTFEIIQHDLSTVGIKLTLRTMDGSAAWNAITAPNGKYLNYDLSMWDWVPLVDPDFILSVMTCDSWNDWNDTGYCNPAYDKLYQKQSTEMDVTKRHQLVDQMQQMIYQDKPYIVLDYLNIVDAWSKGWDGFVETPQGLYNALSKASLLSVHKTA
ncbi:MAG TPA: peptide ABC transporter substrate-binding protein [Nocardioidaceae bacterium]|nr:peptide ABC transporter substrate-binding protein [Nocardioidaceae bacterium]